MVKAPVMVVEGSVGSFSGNARTLRINATLNWLVSDGENTWVSLIDVILAADGLRAAEQAAELEVADDVRLVAVVHRGTEDRSCRARWPPNRRAPFPARRHRDSRAEWRRCRRALARR